MSGALAATQTGTGGIGLAGIVAGLLLVLPVVLLGSWGIRKLYRWATGDC